MRGVPGGRSVRHAGGLRRLAVAVRGNSPAGPLPAPCRSGPALRALDDALPHVVKVLDRGGGPT